MCTEGYESLFIEVSSMHWRFFRLGILYSTVVPTEGQEQLGGLLYGLVHWALGLAGRWLAGEAVQGKYKVQGKYVLNTRLDEPVRHSITTNLWPQHVPAILVEHIQLYKCTRLCEIYIARC